MPTINKFDVKNKKYLKRLDKIFKYLEKHYPNYRESLSFVDFPRVTSTTFFFYVNEKFKKEFLNKKFNDLTISHDNIEIDFIYSTKEYRIVISCYDSCFDKTDEGYIFKKRKNISYLSNDNIDKLCKDIIRLNDLSSFKNQYKIESLPDKFKEIIMFG